MKFIPASHCEMFFLLTNASNTINREFILVTESIFLKYFSTAHKSQITCSLQMLASNAPVRGNILQQYQNIKDFFKCLQSQD